MGEDLAWFPSVKAWLVTVDMGYGHQRAAYPLRGIAEGGIIVANDYPGMPDYDRRVFGRLERMHISLSRLKKLPLLGPLTFRLYDQVQAIPRFDPTRDMSRPTLQVRGATRLIRRQSWGRHLIGSLWERKRLPFLTTFFSPAHMADLHGYPGPIYCVICDVDMSRDWVAQDPRHSRIFYFAPTQRVCERLKLYGVPPERALLTGFPLPDENLGYPEFGVLRRDMATRLPNLDPQRRYLLAEQRQALLDLGIPEPPPFSGRPLTIMFAVGGAGAQAEIGVEALQALADRIRGGEVRLHLVAGVSERIRELFEEALGHAGLSELRGGGVSILFEPQKSRYFEVFNRTLRETDILWTKPSELSFYVALGVPILMAPPIGSQEDFNREWLLEIGAALEQKEMRHFAEWFDEYLRSGAFARAALSGYSRAPRMGTYNIINHLAQTAPREL
jgi:hypothetical protein